MALQFVVARILPTATAISPPSFSIFRQLPISPSSFSISRWFSKKRSHVGRNYKRGNIFKDTDIWHVKKVGIRNNEEADDEELRRILRITDYKHVREAIYAHLKERCKQGRQQEDEKKEEDRAEEEKENKESKKGEENAEEGSQRRGEDLKGSFKRKRGGVLVMEGDKAAGIDGGGVLAVAV